MGHRKPRPETPQSLLFDFLLRAKGISLSPWYHDQARKVSLFRLTPRISEWPLFYHRVLWTFSMLIATPVESLV